MEKDKKYKFLKATVKNNVASQIKKKEERKEDKK